MYQEIRVNQYTSLKFIALLLLGSLTIDINTHLFHHMPTMAHKCHIRYYMYLHRSSFFQNLSYYYHIPHAIINKSHVIITHLMLLSTVIMLLSNSSCYYPSNLCYQRTTCAIIRHLNDSCYYQTHHVIIRHLMLLSTPQPIILTVHIILLFNSAAPAHCGATGRALAYHA